MTDHNITRLCMSTKTQDMTFDHMIRSHDRLAFLHLSLEGSGKRSVA